MTPRNHSTDWRPAHSHRRSFERMAERLPLIEDADTRWDIVWIGFGGLAAGLVIVIGLAVYGFGHLVGGW